MESLDNILALIASTLEDRSITLHTKFSQDLDSLKFVNLIVAFEDRYAITFDDSEFIASRYQTVNDFVDIIIYKLSQCSD